MSIDEFPLLMGEEMDEQSAKMQPRAMLLTERETHCLTISGLTNSILTFSSPSHAFFLGESTTICQLTTHTFPMLFFLV